MPDQPFAQLGRWLIHAHALAFISAATRAG
jgi:hypothetical protein